MPRTFAVLLAVLPLLPPCKAVASPLEGASGKMASDNLYCFGACAANTKSFR
jgi:hypothetical protein